MSADYMVRFPCEVRRLVSDEQLMGMLKAQARVDTLVASIRKDNPDMPMEQILRGFQVNVITLNPQGQQVQKSVTVAEIGAQAAPLARLSAPCANCPARASATDFGCSGVINYPISKGAEAWLMARLSDDMKSPTLSLLFKFLQENKNYGRGVQAQRSRREMWELDKPIVRKWGGLFSKQAVDSNQLLELTVLVGSLETEQAGQLAKMLNFADPDWQAPTELRTQPGVDQLRRFMRAVVLAGSLKVPLWMDS